MIKARFSLVAEAAIIDVESNNVSIINVLDDITAESFPLVMQRIAHVAALERESVSDDANLIKLKITVNDKVLLDNVVKIDFRNKLKSKGVVRINGIIFPEPGLLKFDLIGPEDQTISSYSINLNQRQPVQVVSAVS